MLDDMTMMVREGTYNIYRHRYLSHECKKYWERRGITYGKGDMPVPMLGSWDLVVTKPYSGFIDELVLRYMRRYKITILSKDDAIVVETRLRNLIFNTKKEKRRVYYLTNKKSITLYTLFKDRSCMCFVLGKEKCLPFDETRVIKSILIQKNKLDKVIKQQEK